MDVETHIAEEAPLFDEQTGFTRSTAWACVVYSLAPFLGLIFTPAAIVFAALEYRRSPKKGDNEARNKLYVFPVATVIGVCQLTLWWLLYLIPNIGR